MTVVRKPSGIDERPEQLRPPIVKADGVTETEKYLAKLAEKSFLNLWSYPSPYRNQKQAGGGDGKELCDLLIVCGRHVIIFSEKTISWPSGDLNTAWCRWAKRAIRDAAKQAHGAERWISEFPDRIFLDRKCTVPFPIDFPPPGERLVHRIVVARGAAQMCRNHLESSSGSLIIKPAITGEKHWSGRAQDIQPFAIGDLNPSGSYVHVVDEVTLDIILAELDTVQDFTDYLEKKEAFIRSGRLAEAHGEENLLAYYAVRINADGDHDFTPNKGEPVPITIDRQQYQRFIENPQYIAKKEADKISYLWDMLIKAFTDNMLGGTSITLDGYGEFDLRMNELGVRYMALQPRFLRRGLGEAVKGALERGRNEDRFFRTVMGNAGSKEDETAFFIQTYKYLEWMEDKGGYEKYRRMRTEYAKAYALGLLEKHPHLKRVVGISREPPDQGRGLSEDLVYVEQAEWSDDERQEIRKNCKSYGILQGEMKPQPWKGQEFPEFNGFIIERPSSTGFRTGLNRKQRRAQRAQERKIQRR